MLMAELGFIAAQTSVLERVVLEGVSGIMAGQKTDLVVMQDNLNAHRYIDDVLRLQVIPFLCNQRRGVTFLNDNSRPHAALITQPFVAQNNVDVLPWPDVFSDLNPIEHVSDELGWWSRKNHQINTLQDLQIALIQEWQTLPNALIQQYVNRGHTRY